MAKRSWTIPFTGQRRLRSLDEFETPEFVGRMERVRRLRMLFWRLILEPTARSGRINYCRSLRRKSRRLRSRGPTSAP